MNNKKVASLLNKGIKFETLKMLNETQIDTLYTAVIGEQESLSDKVQDVQQLKGELSQLNQAIDQTIQKIGEEENEDGLEDLARQDYTGQEGPHDEKDMAPDGMDDDSDNNRSEMGEEEEVKKQNEIRQIEESIVSLVKKYVPTTMSKKDLMNLLEQGPGTKEAPVKTPTRTKPERKTPYKPKHKPAPKAGETETAPSRVKPGTIEKPERKTPYKPKHKPAPKAGKKELPSFLKFNTLNIQFRDEQED